MQQIHIISIGKLSEGFRQLAEKYEKMIKWNIKSTEILYSKKLPEEQIKQFEAKLIGNYLATKSYKIVLDELGRGLTSLELAKALDSDIVSCKTVDIVIGGAFGLDRTIMDIANLKLSLSKMTLPHQMVKVILLEQIYRCQTILEKHPYHK